MICTFDVQDLGLDTETGQLLANVNGDWYELQPEHQGISSVVKVPSSLLKSQEASPEGRFHFTAPMLESLQIRKPGGRVGVVIEGGADDPAWRD